MGGEIASRLSEDRTIEYFGPADLKAKVDVVIDFSSPDGTALITAWCQKNKVALVSGTTGLSPLQEKELVIASKEIPVFRSPNMSLGLNGMIEALKTFCQEFSEGEVVIEETHHKNKKDSPSGTAKLLHHIVRENVKPEVKVSEPVSFRVGEVFGVHKVSFIGGGEVVNFEHQALSRGIFAQGAIHAAKWLVGKGPGLYSMEDMLRGQKP